MANPSSPDKPVILVVDDEPQILRVMRVSLPARGYNIVTAAGGEQALDEIRKQAPDLVILDLAMPEMSGLEVCRRVRDFSSVPIIVLSAKGAESDKIAALDMGADDYVTKPFSPREVTLRIRAILRRGEKPEETLKAGSISIDPARHQVRVNSKRVHLTSLEFKLLRTLMQRRGRVQERDKLLNDVWGYESVIDTRTVDTHVRRLREKLGKAGDAIETVRGFGYRLRE